MIDELRAMAVFARVAETGSFRAAAGLLGLAPSVVSHHVGKLEARLGVPLLYRSSRRLSLTPEGERLFASAQEMVEAATRGLDGVAGGEAGLGGELRLTMPGFLERTALVDDLAAFLRARPNVHLRLVATEARRDLVADSFDLAIRMGRLEDSALQVRREATLRRVLVAAPGWVAGRAAPVEADDLRGWDLVQLDGRPAEVVVRRRGTAGDWARVPLRARATCASAEGVLGLALRGLGMATLPRVFVQEALDDGRLVEVLPGWELEALGIYLVWPAGARRRVLTAQLAEFLSPCLRRIFSEGEAGEG